MTQINTSPDSAQPKACPVTKPFTEWNRNDAKAVVDWIISRRVGAEGFAANRAYAQDHNHYQNGDGWIGPQGADNLAARSRVSSNVQRQFTPVDTTAEVLDNIANALLQQRPGITLEPLVPPKDPNSEEAQAQQAEIAGIVGLVNQWAEEHHLWQKTRDVVKRARWATWGTLRVWVPPVETDAEDASSDVGTPETTGEEVAGDSESETTVALPQVGTLEEALPFIDLAAATPDQAFVYRDPDTQKHVGIFLFTDGQQDSVELCWVDDAGQTQFKVVGVTTDEVGHDLGGVLGLHQMDGELLLTAPVRMQQAQLNFANSIMTRVMETAGFPERSIVDGEPEGDWEPSAPADTIVLETRVDATGRTWFLVPREGRTLGANIVNEVRSIVDPGNQSGTVARQAQVIKFDPTDPEYIIKAVKQARSTILRQCKQGHLDMDDQATSSGWSRVQARAGHLADVSAMKAPLIRLLKGTVEGLLRHAALMSNEAKAILAKYRVAVTVQVTLGPVDPEERTAILAMLAAGALALTTALTLLQVEDVPAEVERIRDQPESQRAALKQQSEIMQGLVLAGASFELAAELAGLSTEQLAVIKKHQNAEPPQDQTPPFQRNGGQKQEAPA